MVDLLANLGLIPEGRRFACPRYRERACKAGPFLCLKPELAFAVVPIAFPIQRACGAGATAKAGA